MTRLGSACIAVAALTLGGACGEREPPPTREPAPAPRVIDSARAGADTLRGDSVMARDTAGVPE